LDIPCPKCKHKIPETVGRLETNPDLTCPNCGASFQIEAEELKRVLADAERALAEFKRKLERDYFK